MLAGAGDPAKLALALVKSAVEAATIWGSACEVTFDSLVLVMIRAGLGSEAPLRNVQLLDGIGGD